MLTSDSPPKDELQQYQAVVQQLASLSGEIEHLSASLETQLHNLSNTVGQQNLEIRSLQQALPDPPPIFDEDVLNEHPPATCEPSNTQGNQGQTQNKTEKAAPSQKGKKTEVENETIDLQLLAKRLTVIESDLCSLPPKLERGITATLFSSFNPKTYILYVVGAAIAHCVLTTGLVVAGSHLFPAPLSAQNEGQLFQIYKKIR